MLKKNFDKKIFFVNINLQFFVGKYCYNNKKEVITMNKFSQKAAELFMQGHSCSESVVKAAYETGIIDKSVDHDILNQIISPFSGAMGSHQSLCGAVAGAQLVLGLLFGRTGPSNDPNKIKELANEFNAKFKEQRNTKTLCCRALRAGFDEDPVAARNNCANIVHDSTMILGSIVDKVGSKV